MRLHGYENTSSGAAVLTHPARVDQGRKREVIMPSYDQAWNVAIVAASKTP
jgi:hypothetical protein